MALLGKIRHHAQRQIKGFDNRRKFARLVGATLPQAPDPIDPDAIRITGQIRQDGLAVLPKIISQSQIKDILSYLSNHKVENPYRPELGQFEVGDRTNGSNIGAYSSEVLSRCPHLLEIANTPIVLDVISSFFGKKPTLSKIALWHSFATNQAAQNAENYHRDVDDVLFLKFFIYLTDVDEMSGPHVFIRGSQNDKKFLDIRRYSDSEIETSYPADDVLKITGKSGSAFIENTYGLHKGLVARAKSRILLQFEYSLFPIGAYNYEHGYIDAARFDSYINRLHAA
ncbi:phytanoyl-CoA dioxygenase family protein [Parasphingorhabdus sp.]|uniref:phytanoyl-CoA dioxygenase family protein n=1 Tax=Parasphingorhabdus sp. TaxID=2709688 RepID=UPI003A8CA369